MLAGVPANTCVEATCCFALGLGHHVTLVPDAAAALLPEMMHVAHELNGPTFAHAIVTTDWLVDVFDSTRHARTPDRTSAALPHAVPARARPPENNA
ncbi:isochorismatase family protein [Streptomyces sp. NPDC046900]|uniref:isochorismatase family protein n=1 Tax=Streptomyces sp. NPDC046900 TaxID=3155473 RepID=UPI0033E2FE91